MVKHRVRLGEPLPFSVRDADQTLLLARGQRIDSDSQLQALFERGALVDLAELHNAAEGIATATPAELPRLWSRCLSQVSDTLLQPTAAGFTATLDEASAPVQALIARDPDLAIFHVLRHGGDADVAYGVRRSLQTAITTYMVANRLGWEPGACERGFKVALTMNISMLALQGQLARQATAPSVEQRTALQTHPMRSVRALEQAGVHDADWLGAVLRHHELEDGSGYPAGTTDVGELASLVRRADAYTAKLSARSHRVALMADVAGRQMFMQDPGHPMTAALVREFGIYPPGCFVRLKSGELAVVVQRGPTITTPVVACLTDARGMPTVNPTRIDTATDGKSVAAVVGEGGVNARLSMDRLAALVTA